MDDSLTSNSLSPSDDLSALAWVHEELRKSLDAAHKALHRCLKDVSSVGVSDMDTIDPAVLRTARQQIHQGVGALELAGITAGAALLRASEAVVQKFVNRPQSINEGAVQDIEKASFALLDYISRKLAGKPVSATALFPQYEALMARAGSTLPRPTDLWSQDWPTLSLEAPLAPPADVLPRAADAGTVDEFETGLLNLMRRNQPADAAALAALCASLAAGASQRQAHRESATWMLASGFLEGVGGGHVPLGVHAKRVLSSLLGQLRVLVKGQATPSDRLASELLFFCAQANDAPAGGDSVLARVRRTFGLERHQPVNLTAATLGRFDPAWVTQALKRVAGAKDGWSAVAAGELLRLGGLSEQFALVSDSLRRLFPDGDVLAQAMARAVQETVQTAREPEPGLAMEVATSLLYVEACLEDGEFDQPEQRQRVQRLADRIQRVSEGQTAPPLEGWMEDLYRRVSDRQTIGSVVQELRTTLSEVEKHIDQFFRDAQDKSALMDVPTQLQSMRGVLAVLGLDTASQAAVRMREDVDHLLQPDADMDQAGQSGVFDRLATNLGALGFLIDMMGVQPALAKSLFNWDAETGVLSPVMGREKKSRLNTDDPVEAAVQHVEHVQREEAQAVAEEVSETLERADASLNDVSEQLQKLAETPHIQEQADLVDSLAQAQAALASAQESADEASQAAAREQVSQVLSDLSQAISLPEEAPEPVVTAPAPLLVPEATALPESTGLEEDDEMRGIFLEEAREVIDNAREALGTLASHPDDVGALTAVRRGFHTLKGSSRMVGLNAYGEAAWACEQLYNAWLATQAPASADLQAVTGEMLDHFQAWTEAIERKQDAAWTPDAAVAVADALRLRGERSSWERAPVAEVPLDAPMDAPPTWQPEPSTLAPLDTPDAAPSFDTVEVIELTEPALPDAFAAHEAEPVPGLAPEVAFEEAAPEVAQADVPVLAPEDSISVGDTLLPALEALTPAPSPFEPAPPVVPELGESVVIDVATLDQALSAEHDPGDTVPQGLMAEPVAEQDLIVLDLAAPSEAPFVGADGQPEMVVETLGHLSEPAPLMSSAEDAQEEAPLGDMALRDPIEVMALDDDEHPTVAADLDGTPMPAEAPVASPVTDDVAAGEPMDDQVKVVGPLRISIPLFNIYLNEADEQSRRLSTTLSEWALELERPVPDEAIALAHSLAGNSATVGYADLSQLARLLEHALMRSQALGPGEPEAVAMFNEAAEEIRRLLHQFAAGFLKSPAEELMRRLEDYDLDASRRIEARSLISDLDDGASAQDAGTASSDFMPTDARAHLRLVHSADAPVTVPQPLIGPSQHWEDESDIDVEDAVDPDLFPIFEEEAQELLPQLATQTRQWLEMPDHPAAAAACMRTLHTFKGGARLAGAMRLGELAHRMESTIERLLGGDSVTHGDLAPLEGRVDRLIEVFEALRQRDADAYQQQSTALPPAEPLSVAAPEAEAPSAPPPFASFEAPAEGPSDEAAVDQAGQDAMPSAPAMPLAEGSPLGAIDWAALPGHSGGPLLTPREPAAAPLQAAVRVRPQLLDRLVNHAGEVSITRTRLHAQVGQIRGSLTDLTDNLERLRQQLRDIELQAETQVTTRMEAARAASQAFDPLEFDRYTRFQELTRMMAESVNDVATVQRTLQRSLETAEDQLAAQARLTRDLQDDLLRTRMVEFESLSDRLYRVVRLAAKETGKQVRLDIVGGATELDRGVLDRMIGSFEHLLRNCVTHGIEAPWAREQAGKDATGQITVSLKQEGNEVSVEVRDDGMGLNLARIQERGVAQGLIAWDAQPTPSELAQLIFTPGFSTADAVTELAGRGVGMDVVRSEVNAMGGRIETDTEAGQGTRFTLILPLTTAVTKVVMLRCGTLSVAVPTHLIEMVRRARPQEVEQAYRDGHYGFADLVLPFYWLGALLDASPRGLEGGRSLPVVIVRSAQQRIALHVDEVLGNQEVVVKNLGTQLSRLPGLAGMTLLASGAVSLIYNPVALAAVYGAHALQTTAAALAADAPGQASWLHADGPTATAVPVQPEEAQTPLVLVVDDSLTVRKVTQRLLAREGYRVKLAKDGLEALELLAQERPSVVLSDIEMPRMDGFDLVRNIRADQKLSDLPVIMITSRIAQKHRDYASELGVNHYLGKPYGEEELLALVARYVREALAAPA